MNKKHSIRIGSGAGYSGDRIDPAVELACNGNLDYLVFECLAERTIALAQKARKSNPGGGYDPLLKERLQACIPPCFEHGTSIITNMGAANPISAMQKAAELIRAMDISNFRIAAVTGDDVFSAISQYETEFMETGEPLSAYRDRIISANAYLGAAPIVEALESGANLVITGRVADPALFIAPLIVEFGWEMDDYPLLGQGTVLGHLMECAGQITGGYFADPGYKDVPGLADLGFPIAEVRADGEFIVTKLESAGGMITEATCKEQLLYEIHDPSKYLTPDVVADFSKVKIQEIEENVVRVTGGTGRSKSGMLKVSVGYLDGWVGEGNISYGGAGAVERGRLALDIIRKRLSKLGISEGDMDLSLIGLNSLFRDGSVHGSPHEVRARVAARAATEKEAMRIANEVEALYTNGPAAGGGVMKSVREVIAIRSILIPEDMVKTEIQITKV
jgi:hypothetical protein